MGGNCQASRIQKPGPLSPKPETLFCTSGGLLPELFPLRAEFLHGAPGWQGAKVPPPPPKKKPEKED